MILSALRTPTRRFGIIFLWTSALYVIYQLTNHLHLVAPRMLPVTAIDRAIPFLSWTVVPYFVLILGMYLPGLVRERRLFLRTLAALTIAVLLNYAIFALCPTIYPRPDPPTGMAFYDHWYRWLVSIDTPANCFPSGHITAPAIGCWALAQEHRRQRWIIRLLFIPFALTILTTKQHYLWDLFGGLATAAIGISLTWRLRTPTTPFAQPSCVAGPVPEDGQGRKR
jgi:hypothetical protein